MYLSAVNNVNKPDSLFGNRMEGIMDIKISTGDYKILKSGSVILFNEDSQMNMEVSWKSKFQFQ